MKSTNKLTSTYIYPSKVRGEHSLEVGFFLDSRKDRYGNVLKKINVVDNYGDIYNIKYSGNSLMISVKTSPRTTSVIKATRELLLKYKEAYEVYLNDLSSEDRKQHITKPYLYLEELPPVETEEEAVEEKAKAIKPSKNKVEETEK
jgi:hypothetical protein